MSILLKIRIEVKSTKKAFRKEQNSVNVKLLSNQIKDLSCKPERHELISKFISNV